MSKRQGIPYAGRTIGFFIMMAAVAGCMHRSSETQGVERWIELQRPLPQAEVEKILRSIPDVQEVYTTHERFPDGYSLTIKGTGLGLATLDLRKTGGDTFELRMYVLLGPTCGLTRTCLEGIRQELDVIYNQLKQTFSDLPDPDALDERVRRFGLNNS